MKAAATGENEAQQRQSFIRPVPAGALPPNYPVIPLPMPVQRHPASKHKKEEDDHWAEMKKRWDERMEWERERRQKYGGAG